jgi:hypothetical protein
MLPLVGLAAVASIAILLIGREGSIDRTAALVQAK